MNILSFPVLSGNINIAFIMLTDDDSIHIDRLEEMSKASVETRVAIFLTFQSTKGGDILNGNHRQTKCDSHEYSKAG